MAWTIGRTSTRDDVLGGFDVGVVDDVDADHNRADAYREAGVAGYGVIVILVGVATEGVAEGERDVIVAVAGEGERTIDGALLGGVGGGGDEDGG